MMVKKIEKWKINNRTIAEHLFISGYSTYGTKSGSSELAKHQGCGVIRHQALGLESCLVGYLGNSTIVHASTQKP